MNREANATHCGEWRLKGPGPAKEKGRSDQWGSGARAKKMRVHVRGERKRETETDEERGREEKEKRTVVDDRVWDRDESRELPVKSIRDMLVKVYTFVRHEHKAIRTIVVFQPLSLSLRRLIFIRNEKRKKRENKKENKRDLKKIILWFGAVLISMSLKLYSKEW